MYAHKSKSREIVIDKCDSPNFFEVYNANTTRKSHIDINFWLFSESFLTDVFLGDVKGHVKRHHFSNYV